MDTVRIVDVELRAQAAGRVLYRITAEDGTKYATTDPLMASLCKRAMETNQSVKVWSGGGWYYRDLTFVELVPASEVA